MASRKTTSQPRTSRTPMIDPRGSATAAPTPQTKPSEDDEDLAPRGKKDPMVSAKVPRAFILTADNGEQITYQPGIVEMPKSHAEHWYSQHHGVEIVS